MGQLIVIVAMFALLWLLLIRPQRRRQLQQQELISSVRVGDEILTAGGVYGFVRELGENDELVVEIAPDVEVRIARRAVAAVMPLDDADGEDEPEDEELESAEEPATPIAAEDAQGGDERR